MKYTSRIDHSATFAAKKNELHSIPNEVSIMREMCSTPQCLLTNISVYTIILLPEKMSSGPSDMESLTTTRGSSGLSSGITRKWKIALASALLLGALTAVGVCAAAAVVAGTNIGGSNEGRRSTRSLDSHEISSEDVEVSQEVTPCLDQE